MAVTNTPFAEVHSLEGDQLCSAKEQTHRWTDVDWTGRFSLLEIIPNHSTLLSLKSVHLEAIISSFSTMLKPSISRNEEKSKAGRWDRGTILFEQCAYCYIF